MKLSELNTEVVARLAQTFNLYRFRLTYKRPRREITAELLLKFG